MVVPCARTQELLISDRSGLPLFASAGGEQRVAIGGKEQRLHAAPNGLLDFVRLHPRGVPEANRTVEAAGRIRLAAGMHRCGKHLASMALELDGELARLGVVNSYDFVATRGGKLLAVGAESKSVN